MKRWISLLLCLLMVPLCAGGEETKRVYRKGEIADFAPDEALLELYVCPVIGADAMVMVCEGHVMAVDVGKLHHDEEIVKVLDRIGERHLEAVFNSHPHDDHCGGMLNLVKDGVAIDRYITAFPDYYPWDGSMQSMVLKTVRKANIPVERVGDGDEIRLGGARLTCMQRMFKSLSLNNSSCVLLVEYGQCSMLLTADLQIQGQLMLVRDHPALGHVDILKVPHHGVVTLKPAFMDILTPEFAFITNGSYTAELSRELLEKRGIPCAYTSRGLLHFATNGKYWIVDQEITDPRFM